MTNRFNCSGWNKGKGKAYAWLMEHASYQGDDCLVWPFYRLPNGYGQFGYLGKQHYAHRFMCGLVRGEPPEGLEAAHSCGGGNIGCVNPRHLDWKTKSQNRFDALRHGTGVKTYGGPKGSLTEETVNAIRALHGLEKQATISAMFGVSEPRIRAIFAGKIYTGQSKINFFTPEEDARILELHKAGHTDSDIARNIGRGAASVSRHARLMGLAPNYDRATFHLRFKTITPV